MRSRVRKNGAEKRRRWVQDRTLLLASHSRAGHSSEKTSVNTVECEKLVVSCGGLEMRMIRESDMRSKGERGRTGKRDEVEEREDRRPENGYELQ